jgi:serine/threonine protein kinase/tetratricopeptide (TPR) repeat protein
VSVDQFREQLLGSGLITQKNLDEFLATLTDEQRSSAELLARELLQAKLLTKYQLQLISQGMGQLLSFGDYVLQERIGSGGMGTVYRAIHTKMNRSVAIKILNPKLSSNPALLDRFDREVRATAKLQHINIVHAYDAGEFNRAHFLVMELVDGVDLNRVIAEKGPLSVRHALECIRQVAEGLKYAHSQGIIHRDVKPSNILLSRAGVIKLSDMGLVRVSQDWDDSDVRQFQANLSRTGLVMGSVNFMAPEQAMDSRETDERSDIYSLGATLYYLLTASTMFNADTATKTILAMQTAATPSLRDVREDVSEKLDAVFRKMVARQPRNRFATMGHLLDAIKQCGEVENASASPPRNKGALPPVPGSLLGDSSLSQDYWGRADDPASGEPSPASRSINVLDDDSFDETSDQETLFQMMPGKNGAEFMESSILQEVTRWHRRAMLIAIIPLSIATIYFFARSLQQFPGSGSGYASSGFASAPSAREAELRELLPDLDEKLWSLVVPAKPASGADAPFEVNDHGTILMTPASLNQNRLVVTAPLKASRITGVRLELIPPTGDPGETAESAAHRFQLTNLELRTHSKSSKGSKSPPVAARFRAAFTDDYLSSGPAGDPLLVSHAIDGNPATGWGVGPRYHLPHWAVFVTDPDSVSSRTNQIVLSLEFADHEGESALPRRFRILVTDKPHPMLQEMVRRGNLSDVEKRAAGYLIRGNPREASDLLQSAREHGAVESGPRLILLAMALQDQLLIGPARKACGELARWLRENRTGHPLLLSLAEHVLVTIDGWDEKDLEQLLAGSKLEYQIVAWTAKLNEATPAESEFYLRRRAEAHARLGQWKRSAADALKVASSASVDDQLQLQSLISLIASGDWENYREHCRLLAEWNARPAEEATFASPLCQGFLLHSEGVPFAEHCLRGLDRELARIEVDDPNRLMLLTLRALADYHAGQPRQALEAVRRALDTIDDRDDATRPRLAAIRALSLAVRARASLELGNFGEASAALREADALVPAAWKRILDPALVDQVIPESEPFDWDWVVAALWVRDGEHALSASRRDFDNDDSRAL